MCEKFNWISLGALTETSTNFSDHSKNIGIYRAILNDEVVYIGKATELNNGGFRKRLRDYTRSSSSARNYPAGEKMYYHRNDIQIEIVVFERSADNISIINQAELQLINQIRPIWNKQDKS